MAQRLLLQAQTALGSYADPDWACADGWPAFADRLLELARAAEPGFGPPAGVRQRAVHVGAVAAATSPCWRRCWTTNPPSSGPGGPGRRHRSALAHRHRAGRRRRHRRRRAGRRRSSTPRRSATRPRRVSATPPRASAARPQAAVKDAAWQQVIEDDTLANITGRAIIGGFVQPGQARAAAAVHAPSTSTRSRACGSGGPARSRRRSSSGCTRRGTSARPAWTPPTGSWPTRGAAGAAEAGHRGPRRRRARTAGPRLRRHLTATWAHT